MKIAWNEDRLDARGGALGSSPSRLFDANGLEWKGILWCDTETGEIEQFLRDEQGKIELDSNGDALIEVSIVARPLIVVPVHVGG